MKRFFISLSLVFVSVVCVMAQTTTGRLSGTVSGPDGALPGATVVVTSTETGKELTVTASGDGAFLFPQLEVGTYTVKITAAGFKTYIANEVKIDVGRDYTLSPTLEIGNVQESVTVTAGADVITATTSQISNTVSPQQILSLPLIARNPLDLTRLQSGVQSNQFQNTTINGVRTSFTNITRDGINIQDSFIRTNATDFAPGRPSVDDTAEFTVITSNQEADQGYGSAQIRLVTPRGTKNFSGALFAYNRNSEFAANNFFSNRSGAVRPFRNRNQFGGKIGGPMPVPGFGEGTPQWYKNKGFFFFSYEKIIDPLSSGATRTILTPSARNGAFKYNRATSGAAINSTVGTSSVTCPAWDGTGTAPVCTISDILGYARASNLPLTTGVGGNPIPATISPVILNRIINKIPTTGNTTTVGDQLNTTGYFLNRKSNQERSTYTGRIDVDLNDRNTINGVYSYNFETNLRPDVDTNGYDPNPQADQVAKNKTLSLSYRRVFSSNIVNEARGGVFFSDVPFRRIVDTPDYMLTVPLITSPETNFTDQGRSPKYFTFQDNVDWIVGKHNLRFGGQMQNYKIKSYNFGNGIPTTTPGFLIQTNSGSTPIFAASNFTGVGGISTTQLGTANGMLGLLAGIVAQGQLRYNLPDGTSTTFEVGPNIQPYKYSNHALYFSDRWQIANNLTLTAGVRYELFPALRLANNLGVEPTIADPDNFIPSLLDRNGTYSILGTNSGDLGTYHKTDFNNFAPSVGIAWSPNFEKGFAKFFLGKGTVIRGGFSRAFGNDQLVTAMNNAIGQNVGLASRTGFALSSTGSTLLNLRLGFDPLPTFTAPVLVPPPFTYVRNNSNTISATPNFGTVFAVDPKLQVPSVDQISVGYQKEFLGNTALEIRYVGTRSDNFVRGVDLNQIDIFSNGFAADVNRAIQNTVLTGNPFCTAAQNAGCQALSILLPSGTIALPISGTATFPVATPQAGRLIVGTNGLAAATFNGSLTTGQPGQLALQFIQGLNCVSYNNHPSIVTPSCPTANPNAVPFVNFVPNPATGAVDVMLNDAAFRYHSVQIELRRRFSQGLYFQANYTFSKNLTNSVGSANSPASGQSLFEPYLDNKNKQWDYTRADFDQTHVFNFNGVYQLPFGKGKMLLNQGGIVDQIFGGWELSGIVQWSSGGPITFTDTRGTLNNAGRSTRQTPYSNLSYDQIRALMGTFEANGNIYWINPSVIGSNGAAAAGYIRQGLNTNGTFNGQAFFNVEPGTTGNIGRFLVNGPKFFNINAALLKSFKFNESGMRLQVRAEAFNLLNNVNFNANAQLANINSTSFGRITSAAASRTIQFAARFEF
ncbi:MAG TPA: TonB-dependent receptor [Pyrinomonadaceae bacterium]|nr:TonB-dependent receptor [Pyrinomonadaceae bacterium]